jgi:hypothetical protein
LGFVSYFVLRISDFPKRRPRPRHRRRQRPPGKRHRGILPGACPRLLAEAELYCYSTDPGRRRAEIPKDDNNHALGDAAT